MSDPCSAPAFCCAGVPIHHLHCMVFVCEHHGATHTHVRVFTDDGDVMQELWTSHVPSGPFDSWTDVYGQVTSALERAWHALPVPGQCQPLTDPTT